MAKRCKKCKGKKVMTDKAQIKVQVEKGMTHGEKITCHG